MLAVYVQAPLPTRICAIVDVKHDVAVWVKDGATGSAFYSDQGVGNVKYDNPVPRLVERLVEHKTGKKIRIGCK
jgi:hypothetical protein